MDGTITTEGWLVPSKNNLNLPAELTYPPSYAVLPAKFNPIYGSEVVEIISHTLIALFASGFLEIRILSRPENGKNHVSIFLRRSARQNYPQNVSGFEMGFLYRMPSPNAGKATAQPEYITPTNLVMALFSNQKVEKPGQTIANRVVDSIEAKGTGHIKARSWIISLLVEPNNEIEWNRGVKECLLKEKEMIKEIFGRLTIMYPGFKEELEEQISSGISLSTLVKRSGPGPK